MSQSSKVGGEKERGVCHESRNQEGEKSSGYSKVREDGVVSGNLEGCLRKRLKIVGAALNTKESSKNFNRLWCRAKFLNADQEKKSECGSGEGPIGREIWGEDSLDLISILKKRRKEDVHEKKRGKQKKGKKKKELCLGGAISKVRLGGKLRDASKRRCMDY